MEALAAVDKKLKEIGAKGRVNVTKEKKDHKKVEKATEKMEARAKREQEKAEKVATKEKVKEEKQKEKMEKKAEKEVVKMKGKVKPMVGTTEQPNPEVTAKPKQSKKKKTNSGTHKAIASVYNKQQEAATTAMNRSGDEQDALATGESGENEVRKVKG